MRTALTIALTSGAVAIVTAAILGLRISRAAQALKTAAQRLGDGERVEEAPVAVAEFRAVLHEMAASSDRLRDAREEIERQERARQELVTRIAHDLRVPLSGIRAQAEALQEGMADDPQRYLARIVAQTDRVDALVADLFAVSQIDSGTLVPVRERVSLADVASDAAAEVRPVAEGAGIRLEVHVADAGFVDADPRQLARATANLLAKALQHCAAGGLVAVGVRTEAERALLVVEDEGPGFAPGELAHVFEAGWRGSAARTPHRLDLTGGAGLGLAIAQGIARAHGGDIRAGNREPQGARVELEVPVAAPLRASTGE